MPQRNGLAAGRLTDEKQAAIRGYRHERLRRVMRERNLPVVLAYDPVNIRYITDAHNMQVYALNNGCRYVMVLADGAVRVEQHCRFLPRTAGDLGGREAPRSVGASLPTSTVER